MLQYANGVSQANVNIRQTEIAANYNNTRRGQVRPQAGRARVESFGTSPSRNQPSNSIRPMNFRSKHFRLFVLVFISSLSLYLVRFFFLSNFYLLVFFFVDIFLCVLFSSIFLFFFPDIRLFLLLFLCLFIVVCFCREFLTTVLICHSCLSPYSLVPVDRH